VRLAALVLALVAAPAAAQTYKCRNERGGVQYTDKPSAGCQEVDIRGSPPISGSLQDPAEDFARRDAEFRQRQNEREASEAKEREALQQRCLQLRREHSLLEGSRRLARINEKGEREFMDDAVREQRLAEMQREMSR
jgi:hypothetical protein